MEKKSTFGYPNDPKFVAKEIRNIIHVLIGRMSLESQVKAYPNIKSKINEFNITEMSGKKQPGGSPIGVSIGLVKNILNGRDPYFIKSVIDELSREL
jgi:hypothetical protein